MSEWKIVRIPEVLFYQEGPGVRNSQYTTSGVKLLNVANLHDGVVDLSRSERYIAETEAYGKYNHFLVDEGDFLIASSGIKVEYFEKKMGFVDASQLPLCMNTSTIRFKPLNKSVIQMKYFMYYLKTDFFKLQLEKLITGSAQLNFGPSHLDKIFIPLPPIEVQLEISKKLDKATRLIDLRKQQIDKMDLMIKSQFIELFGDPVSNSKNWSEKNLGKLGELNRGVSKCRPRNAPKLLGGPYPLIQTGEIACAGLYITDYTRTYSEVGLKQSKMWPKGTLCISIAANIAQTGILKFDACFPDSVVGFIPSRQVKNIYIHYWFGFFQKILEEQAPQVAQKNINLKILNDLAVMVPPIELQNQFAAFVEQVDKSKFDMNQNLERLEQCRNALMQEAFG